MMEAGQVFADVELEYGGKTVKCKGLVDTGASRSVISKELADKLTAFTPLKKPYQTGTADKKGKLKISGFCNLNVIFQDNEVPGGARFEIAENLSRDLIIGRPEIDSWDIIFTPEGPKPRKVPIEFEIL